MNKTVFYTINAVTPEAAVEAERQLNDAIETINGGPLKAIIAPANMPAPALGDRTLSAREQQILSCLIDGSPNKVIAHRLNITEATVKVHLKGLLRKIHCTNRTQAALWALNNGYSSAMAA